MPRNTAFTVTPDNGQKTPAFAVVKVVYPATAIVATDYSEFDLGFTPTKVTFINVTDRVTIEWFRGMTDNTSLKTAAAGTRTVEAQGVTPTARGFRVSQNATLAAILASKECYFIAEA
jgi:hypothetical protein